MASKKYKHTTQKSKYDGTILHFWENSECCVAVWHDWDGKWNAYVESMKKNVSKKLYRGKLRKRAIEEAKRYMK